MVEQRRIGAGGSNAPSNHILKCSIDIVFISFIEAKISENFTQKKENIYLFLRNVTPKHNLFYSRRLIAKLLNYVC